jgi:hypothetical protein
MHENYSDNVNALKTTRRVMLKAATAATLGAVLEPLAEGQPSAPLDYGKGAGQAHLDSTNVFPLLAAWLLLTTNGPADTVDEATIASVANISGASAKTIFNQYNNNQQAFSTVRQAFGEVAKSFATSAPYSGGQCPEKAATVKPIAALRGPNMSHKKSTPR